MYNRNVKTNFQANKPENSFRPILKHSISKLFIFILRKNYIDWFFKTFDDNNTKTEKFNLNEN